MQPAMIIPGQSGTILKGDDYTELEENQAAVYAFGIIAKTSVPNQIMNIYWFSTKFYSFSY